MLPSYDEALIVAKDISRSDAMVDWASKMPLATLDPDVVNAFNDFRYITQLTSYQKYGIPNRRFGNTLNILVHVLFPDNMKIEFSEFKGSFSGFDDPLLRHYLLSRKWAEEDFRLNVSDFECDVMKLYADLL